MAEIQNFNLGQLLGQAEAIKGARRQNQLGELLAPIQQQSAQLGLDQARLGQTQQLAKGALAMMGGNWQDPEVWNRAITMAEQQGADVRPLKGQPTEEGYRLIQAYASGDQQAMDAATRNFQFLTEGMTEEERLKARRIQLGLDPRAQGSGALTIATTPGATNVVAASEAEIAGSKAGASEEAKLQQQNKYLPMIREKVKQAEVEGQARGEAMNTLRQTEASMPVLREAVEELRELAPIATSTIGGKIFDEAVKQTGFGSTEGATARAKFIAIVDNQVLPLLRQTFGAAFTVAEGEWLRATFGDPDATPEQKMAQLDAFIAQKERNIRAGRAELDVIGNLGGGNQNQQSGATNTPTQAQPAGGVRFLGFE
jgi:hypothetical protein